VAGLTRASRLGADADPADGGVPSPPYGTGPSTLRQGSTRSIMQAMRKTGARRLLFISGSIVADEGESPYLRYLLKPAARHTFLRHVNADFLAAEAEIRASDLDWTIFRPPSLTNKPARGTFRVATERNLPRCFTITRADLAACMLSATPSARPITGWESLTGTEQAVSRLVAEGLNNGQVAARMYISTHTVAHHLRQAFRKLSICSRNELTRIVIKQAADGGGPPR